MSEKLTYEQHSQKRSEILERILREYVAPDTFFALFIEQVCYDDLHFKVFGESGAYLQDREGIYTHEEVARLIELLQKFYSRATPEDIAFLNLPAPLKPEQPHSIYRGSHLQPGYVYLLAEINGKHYKIGRTTNPDNRMKTFEIKLPYKVAYECVIKTDDMPGLEYELHEMFADKRVDGEWFALESTDVAYIKSLAGGAS